MFPDFSKSGEGNGSRPSGGAGGYGLFLRAGRAESQSRPERETVCRGAVQEVEGWWVSALPADCGSGDPGYP